MPIEINQIDLFHLRKIEFKDSPPTPILTGSNESFSLGALFAMLAC